MKSSKILRPHHSFPALFALHERTERDSRGLFFAEGIRPLIEAVAVDFPLEAVFYCPSLLTNEYARRAVRRLRGSGVPCSQLTPDHYRQISRCEEAQGVIIVARQRRTNLADAAPGEGSCWLALDEIRTPGNLGTIVRSAEAFGAAGLILIGDKTDPFDPACVRAAMGALFNIRLVRATIKDFLDWKARHGCLLVGTPPRGTREYFDFDFGPRPILWMGGERQGLSAEQQSFCDGVVRIPMSGRGDSLNVGVAAGICLTEVFRQRHTSITR